MPFKDPERKKAWRPAYQSKNYAQTAAYYARKRADGIPINAPVTSAGERPLVVSAH